MSQEYPNRKLFVKNEDLVILSQEFVLHPSISLTAAIFSGNFTN